jgi:glycosyltransferase involved in cell wall biosynthesis
VNIAEPLETCASTAWQDARPEVSVIVATHNRASYLPGLLDALHAQGLHVEVLVADDGSPDETWPALRRLVEHTTLPVLALRLPHSGGPSVPRNTAVAHARAPQLAVTDDDCLPEAGWAAAVTAPLGAGVAVVQGRTCPIEEHHGPWDRSIAINSPSGLFETCNLGFDREQFLALGGFPTLSVLRDVPRGFGEDVVFGAEVARRGGFAFAADAVVRHRWLPSTYADHLRGARRLSGFPWLVREVPEVAQRLRARLFLTPRSATFDVAVAAALAAAATRRPALLVATTPWLRHAYATARWRSGRPLAVRVGQEALADATALASLVEGSVRYRRLVL